MAFDYIQFTSSTADLTLTRTRTISAAVYDSATSAVDTSFTGVIVFSKDTTSVGDISIATASATAVAGIAQTTITATGVGQLDIRAVYGTATTDGTQSFDVTPREVHFTSSTAEIAAGFARTLTAELRDSVGAIMTDDSTTPITLTKTGAGDVTGLTTVTAAAGIISAAVTATTGGAITITGAYNSTVTSGSTTFTIQPYHIVITSSSTPLPSGSNLLLVAEVRDVSLSVLTSSSASVTFSQAGTGTLSNIGAATALNGIASRLVTGNTVGPLTITAAATSAISDTQVLEITSAPRVTGSGATGRWFSQSPFRITLWDMTGAGRGRGTVKAVISDAKYIGCSSYLNEGGEAFFTLPYNHPQIAECLPLERHYRIDRWDEEDAVYRTIGTGILQDYQATDNETVFYGIDYMAALNQTLTDVSAVISNPSTTVTYDNKTISEIWQSELSAAKNGANSRLGFITVEGTINAATKTYDIFTAGEQRGEFLFNMTAIAQEGTTSKVVFGNRIESSTQSYNSFFLDMNYATTPNNNVRLVYGWNVKRFSYSPNFRNLRTRAVLIATSIFGTSSSKIWSDFATSALVSTYGVIDRVDIQEDLISQDSVSARAAYNLNESAPERLKVINLAVVDGAIIPYKNYNLGDDVRVVIKRGLVNVDTNVTLRGQQWVGREDGSEELSFDFYNRSQREFELVPYREESPISKISVDTAVFEPTTDAGPEHLSAVPIGDPFINGGADQLETSPQIPSQQQDKNEPPAPPGGDGTPTNLPQKPSANVPVKPKPVTTITTVGATTTVTTMTGKKKKTFSYTKLGR